MSQRLQGELKEGRHRQAGRLKGVTNRDTAPITIRPESIASPPDAIHLHFYGQEVFALISVSCNLKS